MSERWDDESVLRDWLSVLSRQRWIVLVAVIVVPVIALAVSRSQQHLYQASADVLVNEQNPTAAALNLNSAVASPPDRYAATQAQLARVGTVAQMTARAANVPQRTAGTLLANSSVSVSPNADLLTFSVTDADPRIAAKLANAYATQFTVYRKRLDTAALTAAIADAQRKLKSIVASGNGRSQLFRRLSARERDLEELQALQATGSSATLVGPATNASLVQPKARRNVLLGIIVGLALGIALAFLRKSLDTRVHSADELQARLGLPLLGQVPRANRRLPQAEKLATLSDPTGAGTEAFRIVKNNLEAAQLQGRARSILITSTTRGDGKSTTAANLAVILARSGLHVILLDLDLRHPTVGRLFSLGRRGITSVADGVAVTDVIRSVDVRADRAMTDTGRLEVVAAGEPPPDPGEFLLSSVVPDALAVLARRCDVLLIDTPPLLAVGDAVTVATLADAVILVAGLDAVRQAALAETRRMLEACPALKLGVIATGSPVSSGRRRFRRSRSTSTRVPARRKRDRLSRGAEAGGASEGVDVLSPKRRPQRVPDA